MISFIWEQQIEANKLTAQDIYFGKLKIKKQHSQLASKKLLNKTIIKPELLSKLKKIIINK